MQLGGVFTVQAHRFQGPLPPPEILAGYDQVVDGGAERIFAMAESQQAHRQRLEAVVIASNTRNETLGVFFAFTLGLAGLGVGGYLLSVGKDLYALAAMMTPLGVILTAFLRVVRSRKKEREAKWKQLSPPSPPQASS